MSKNLSFETVYKTDEYQRNLKKRYKSEESFKKTGIKISVN